MLAFPKEDLPYIVDTDASDYGIGGVLSQNVEGTEHVIAYYSKSLNPAQQKYCTTRCELLAVVATLQPWYCQWIEKEYGITADTSSLLSLASGTERHDTDEEVCSFDLGPEPYKPEVQGRLPSDEWMDDYQQGLVPGGSEPRNVDFDKYLAMPRKPSILDMRQECEESDEVPPTSPERARTPTIGFAYDLLPPRPPSSSVPPTSKTIKRMAIRYMPVTETVTPPISPARAQAADPQTEPDTPSPTPKP